MTRTTIHCDKCEAQLTKGDVRACTAMSGFPPMQVEVTAHFRNNDGTALLCQDCKADMLTHLLSQVCARYGAYERENDQEPASAEDSNPTP